MVFTIASVVFSVATFMTLFKIYFLSPLTLNPRIVILKFHKVYLFKKGVYESYALFYGLFVSRKIAIRQESIIILNNDCSFPVRDSAFVISVTLEINSRVRDRTLLKGNTMQSYLRRI